MADPLVEYMIKLSEDPVLKMKHDADPQKAAEEFGLSAEDVKMIAEHDDEGIKGRCEALTGPSNILLNYSCHKSK